MAKTKSIYTCTECGGQSLKWQGQCPHCTAWNTLLETISEATPSAGANRFSALAADGKVQTLAGGGAVAGPRAPAGSHSMRKRSRCWPRSVWKKLLVP